MKRSIVTFDEILSGRPLAQNSAGAWCLTCLKQTDSENMVEEHRTAFRQSCKVLVKCHGQEELGTFEFGRPDWDADDLKRAMQRRAWFNPHGHETAGMDHNKGEL